jgi:peptide deformylase
MRRLLIVITAALSLVSCRGGFTSAEREIIYAGEGDIMRVLSIDNEADSLTLRQESLPVEEAMIESEEFLHLCNRMLATVQNPDNEGVGIAAPQVGILRRIVAVQRFDKEGHPFEFFLNPEIVERIGEKQSGGEGCLSVPEIRGDVERWQKIRLRYHDEQFAECEEIIEGFTAVIFQHELDHLDGRLFIDYIE